MEFNSVLILVFPRCGSACVRKYGHWHRHNFAGRLLMLTRDARIVHSIGLFHDVRAYLRTKLPVLRSISRSLAITSIASVQRGGLKRLEPPIAVQSDAYFFGVEMAAE